jgi:hypothetical protein
VIHTLVSNFLQENLLSRLLARLGVNSRVID